MSALRKPGSMKSWSGAEPKTVISNRGVGGNERAKASSLCPAGDCHAICSARKTIQRLINQPWSHAGIRRKLASQRDVSAREPALLLAQQDTRGDARLAPTGVVT